MHGPARVATLVLAGAFQSVPLVQAVALQSAPPLEPDAERASLHLPDGFEVELVSSEPQVKKIVDVAFDDSGRMWAVTACEYPRDANEDPTAEAIYRGGGRDEVLVFERGVPHVFADGLSMPMSVLPLSVGDRDVAILQHGSEILRLVDEDGDGRADRREVLLSGFGIQDSHLMPHRFLRAPDGWIWMAQGAFNASLVTDRSGRQTRFDHCKVGRFTPDGRRFELVAAGLNNIWGLVFDRRGEFLIQEANDLGYCVTPLVRDASFPGIGMERVRPYAPWEPPLANFRMGGTGLSGLALSEWSDGFPAPFDATLFLANPIERAVQTVRATRAASSWSFARGPDFVTSDDSRFRPVAVHFGPDESLYVVDWYNPIISHNEVPRSHPDRDKVRTRVWRIRPRSMARATPPDLTRAAPDALLASLATTRTWESRAAWHQIVDRGLVELAPALRARALDGGADVGARLLALWSLEGLRRVDDTLARALLRDPERALRRDAIRGFAASGATEAQLLALEPRPDSDADAQVRAEWIRAIDAIETPSEAAMAALIDAVQPTLAGPTAVCEQDGQLALTGAAHERAFERFLLRKAMEGEPDLLRHALASRPTARGEGRALAALVLDDAGGAEELVGALASLAREPAPEEWTLLARCCDVPAVADRIAASLGDPARARPALDALLAAPRVELRGRPRELALAALRASGDLELQARAATKLRLTELEGDLAAALETGTATGARAVAMLRALVALDSRREALFLRLARGALPGDEMQREALAALARCATPSAAESVLALLPDLTPALRRQGAETLALSKEGALALVHAVACRRLAPAILDERVVDRLQATLAGDAELAALTASFAGARTRVLVLRGGADDYVDSDLDLAGPFTVEAWVQLDEEISNRDGLLASPPAFDFNFADARPRLWLGPQIGDVLIARRPIEAGRWTHVALTRDADGVLRLYLDGELDGASPPRPLETFHGLDVGRTTPGGAAGRYAEVRVWSVARTTAEIALDARRAFDGERPAGLLLRLPGDAASLHGGAAIVETVAGPPLATSEELEAERGLFARYAQLATSGDSARGRTVFEKTCQVCHKLGGVGESVGPPLESPGMRGVDGLLGAILRPSAAVETGYRSLRVELQDGSSLEGLLVARDDATLTLRPASSVGAQPAQQIPMASIARTRWSKLSVMPDGLLQALPDEDAAALLAFLLSQR